jgi:hypothetical protein
VTVLDGDVRDNAASAKHAMPIPLISSFQLTSIEVIRHSAHRSGDARRAIEEGNRV